MPAPEAIRVEGLKLLSRRLRKLDKNLPRELRAVGNDAAKIIIAEAKPRVPVGPPAGGHAKSSLKASSTRTQARVSAGGKRYPYYPWLDFGGSVGRNRSVSRPFFKSGRFIWKAYERRHEQIEQRLRDGFLKVARTAGIEVE